jgi:predicted phage terminase large subunit-like protein
MDATRKPIQIRPQQGPQETFLSTPADIALYGGAAGGGKSWSLLFEPLRHVSNPNFGAVVFRRTAPEITAEGGLWDESFALYGRIGATPSISNHRWDFPKGGSVTFGHMQYEADLLKWHGSQIPLLEFDELTAFTERQFWYMLTRNRSTCGVKPYVRASCNPDASSWVAKWVSWWIDQDTGYPIAERSGVVRWFVRDGDTLDWANSAKELTDRHPGKTPKSFTFVPAKLEDNKILEKADPGYRANLESQPTVDRERLLGGNWKIRLGGKFFDRLKVRLVPSAPVGTVAVRYWDTAATKGVSSANTAGVLLGRTPAGRFIVVHCAAENCSPSERKALLKQVSASDLHRPGVSVISSWIEQPGGFGTESVQDDIMGLAGYAIQANKVGGSSGSKEERWKPLTAQWEVGNVDVVEGDWTESFLAEMDSVPNGRLDRADAAAGAFNKLTGGGGGMVPVTRDDGKSVHDSLPSDIYD